MLGILFGKKAGTHLGKRMELLGGLILIGIGVKILVEHWGGVKGWFIAKLSFISCSFPALIVKMAGIACQIKLGTF